MFGRKKKEPKVEKVFDDASNEETTENSVEEQDAHEHMSDDDKLILGVDKKSSKKELTESQKKQMEDLGSVKDKISKILKSSNIEIVDENFGDEYESGGGEDSDEKKQQDYDSLKSLFGDGDKKGSKELTLTIDDYDYTYTGKYLDEFDMMHLKNIKRIRLQNKYAKKIRKIALIASLVLVVIGGAVTAFLLTREKPVYLKSISMNQLEAKYYINDYFDYSGLYIIAEYSDGRKERVKLDSSHLLDVTGNYVQTANSLQFTGTRPATLRFTYGGQVVDYSITVEERRKSGFAAVYTDELFNLNVGDSINSDNLRLLQKYTNFNSTYFDYDGSTVSIAINGSSCLYDAQTKSFKASQSTKPATAGEDSTATITITYSGYTLEIKYVEGVSFVETAQPQ